jgi:hypothetical protein
VTGSEFIRRVMKHGRKNGVDVRFESRPGKGSHGRLYYGNRFTTVKNRRQEIGKGLLHAMLSQLGLSIDDIE